MKQNFINQFQREIVGDQLPANFTPAPHQEDRACPECNEHIPAGEFHECRNKRDLHYIIKGMAGHIEQLQSELSALRSELTALKSKRIKEVEEAIAFTEENLRKHIITARIDYKRGEYEAAKSEYLKQFKEEK